VPRAPAAELDLLLVQPPSRPGVYQALGRELAAVEPPTWAGMLASFARGRGFSVAILDAEALELTPRAAAEHVAAAAPRLTALLAYGHQPSASTQTMPAARALLAAIREAELPTRTLLVGGHPSALPERTLREEPVDYVCEGEGPQTLEKLLEALRAGGEFDPRAIPGLWWREGSALAHSARAANLAELDRDIPGSAWDLLPMERYRAHNWHCFGRLDERRPYASLYTSLGCPYRCSFCCINAPFGKAGIRYRDPARVVDELELLASRYGVRSVKIADEMFVLSRRHVEGICSGIAARGLRLNLWAYARVDTVQEGLLPGLKAAGFNWLALGIESGSAHVRDGANKRFSQEEIARTVRAIQAHGIHVIGNYIFGLPDDTLATMQQTLELALELNCEFANFYCAMAYPGSALYAQALERGWRLPESWSGYSQHSVDCLPLATEHVSAPGVLRFRDAAFARYFGGERYLAMAERVFGRETREHLRAMLGHKLEREHAP
jgi:anaerobic magnesium-protoporphyrin IX monomethyl ester cyclase